MVSEVVIESPRGGFPISSAFHINREGKRRELVGQQRGYHVFLIPRSCVGSGNKSTYPNPLTYC